MGATPFDPITATFEDADAQPDRRAAIRGVKGEEILRRRRDYFSNAPMDGMAVCARFGIAAPEWLATAFLRRFDMVLNFEVRSWDAAFGLPRQKGINLARARQRRKVMGPLAKLFAEHMNRYPDTAVDKVLWEYLGERVGVSATTAEEIYREALRFGVAMSVRELRDLARPIAPGAPRIVFGAGLTVREALSRANGQPASSPKLAGSRRKK